MSLDFGIFYEIQVPRPWHPRSELEAFHQVVEQAVLAEELGFGSFWTVEHHFTPEFSHSSAPECLYPYIAAKTDRIRLGHGVRLLPFPYNHPVRSAEMAATLDLLSGGRLEFGMGRSLTWDELRGFGIDPKETRPMFDEALDLIIACWTEEVTQFSGKHFNLPPRYVVPKPFQSPHPPLWMASTGPESHLLAGQRGLGLLSFTLLVRPEDIAGRIALYRQGLAEAAPAGKFVNARAATFSLVHVAETNEKARRNAAAATEWYIKRSLGGVASVPLESLAFNPEAVVGRGKASRPTEIPESYEYLKDLFKIDPKDMTFDYLDANDLVIVGDPDHCIEKIKKLEAAGFDTFLPMMQIYDIPHESVKASMRLFAAEVMPHFQ